VPLLGRKGGESPKKRVVVGIVKRERLLCAKKKIGWLKWPGLSQTKRGNGNQGNPLIRKQGGGGANLAKKLRGWGRCLNVPDRGETKGQKGPVEWNGRGTEAQGVNDPERVGENGGDDVWSRRSGGTS